MPKDPIHLNVTSEIGRLRKVMLHRPGVELDRMVPDIMDELLFDDLLFPSRAREEHAIFRQVVGMVADEVLDFQDILAESLEDGTVRGTFVDELVLLESLSDGLARRLRELAPAELAEAAIGGLEGPSEPGGWLRGSLPYSLHPLPNTLFMRDPLVVVRDGALLGSMARKARRREPLIMRYAYGYHPRLGLAKRDLFYFDELTLAGLRVKTGMPGLEGGDVLVLSDKVLAIGASERTSEVAVDLLAQALKERTDLETILLVLLPRKRAVMHLDTVFTQIDRNRCLIFPPLFMPGSPEQAPVIRLDLRGWHVQTKLLPGFLSALVEVGVPLEPISCGGPQDRICQEREQWTDGANALALAPGVITLYERNERTIEELHRHGYEPVHARDLLSGTTPLDLDRDTVILLPDSELSRARGGPRCMSMPLVREPV